MFDWTERKDGEFILANDINSVAEGLITEISTRESQDDELYTSLKSIIPTNLKNGEESDSIQSQSSQALSEGSTALGNRCIAGSKAFNIIEYDDTNKTYTLDSTEGLEVGDVYSLKLDWDYNNVGRITTIVGNKVTVDVYNANTSTSSNLFRIGSKPNCGTIEYSKYCTAIGNNTIALGVIAHAEGYNTQAVGTCSHAEGNRSVAQGNNSHTEGYNTQAIGTCSHAEGNSCTSVGESSHTEGVGTQAVGTCSHAEGNRSVAQGNNSHAEGYNTQAIGTCSHAEGNSCTSVGESSHTEGVGTQAVGTCSHAEGNSTIANGNFSHVQGKYNIEDFKGKYAHIVGNGNGTARSNCHTLDWEGNAWFSGNMEVKGIILNSSTPGSTARYRITVSDGGYLETRLYDGTPAEVESPDIEKNEIED